MPVTPPTITSNGGGSTATIAIDENTLAVTTVTATDAENDTLTYSISGGADRLRFKINATTGLLELRTAPDFENPVDIGSNNTYVVVVRVSDGDMFTEQTITVTISDVGTTIDGTTGDDVLGPTGTTTDTDTLNGLEGNDTLDGGLGADIMNGGDGDDTYYVDNTNDQVVETNADTQTGGNDRVFATASYVLSANVETLELLGDANINATGNASANVLKGNSGNNVLDGKAGADSMSGGDGNDTYVVDDAGDVVVELFDQGTDLVKSSISYTLGANVENLELTGAVGLLGIGNELNNKIVGSAGADDIRGMAGDDILDGGLGVDTMRGSIGDDTYYVDNTNDVVIELANQGTDLVRAKATYTLGANVENLALDGSAAINGTGNSAANVITGNSGANVLMGLGGHDILNGGLGADTMIGGTGNDKYFVNVAGDVVIENANEGNDWVVSTVSYTLTANVDRLTLAGLSPIDGTGNNLDNKIVGNAVNNTLIGLEGDDILNGALGDDTMIGGVGSDTYYVNSLGDTVIEQAGDAGIDTILLSKSGYTMADNVEAMIFRGKAFLNANGNSQNNTITGNSGNNIIDGGAGNDIIDGGNGADTIIGGAGADQLRGGGHADTFKFNAITDSGKNIGVDTDMILDFQNVDKIDLSAIDANAVGGTANDAFVIDTDNIYTAGEIEVTQSGNIVTVQLFTDNVAGADMVFQITWAGNLNNITFIL